jgi:thymidylate synthase (FAD)
MLEKFDGPFGLIRYCALNSHWSIFDTVNLGFEIHTSRDIGRQLLRHSSINPQEFSQRYETVTEIEPIELRAAHKSNRQSSSEVFDPKVSMTDYFAGYIPMTEVKASDMVKGFIESTQEFYDALLDAGVAKECARGILPGAATSKLFMNGTLRSWITFLNVRLHDTTQKEARLIAEAIAEVVRKECPIITKAFYNYEAENNIHFLERVVLEKYKVYETVLNSKS